MPCCSCVINCIPIPLPITQAYTPSGKNSSKVQVPVSLLNPKIYLDGAAENVPLSNKVNPSADNNGFSPISFEYLFIILSIGPHITGFLVKYSWATAGLQLHRSANKIVADAINFFIFHFPF